MSSLQLPEAFEVGTFENVTKYIAILGLYIVKINNHNTINMGRPLHDMTVHMKCS